MDWNIDGLAQIACFAAEEKWDALTATEQGRYRAIAAALLDAICRALSA